MKNIKAIIRSGVSKKASKRAWTALVLTIGSTEKYVFITELEKQYLLDQGVEEEK